MSNVGPCFREFIKAIEFAELALLDDTVTLISLTLAEQSNKPLPIRNVPSNDQTEANHYFSVAHQVFFQIEEDPRRTIYPILDQAQDLPTFEASHLQDEEDIAATVSTVYFKQKQLAYKKIDRPIYEPGDTEHILNEITALEQFRGRSNVAQLIGLVISDNPYKTRPATTSSPVITGFLLEYYPGGSLEQVLAETQDQDDSLLRRWALQIGRALQTLHVQRRTHLDIKPSNIVFDANQNAILIDISGTSGYGWEWLAPEMQQIIERDAETAPASTAFDKRVATDCWAYGKILSTMATRLGTNGLGKRIKSISDALTTTDPKARVSSSHALDMLRV
ncbi:uncharacterized protein LDX57_008157 [Aspergillus melleus]|uniref:uncharacterized protein n=1 Tax=Aspergillus melleus TaxID=138277 RepID=UPI001E8E65A3|nr:uncharacterized protein LDX57_008157 [Aspergillus melleus]KAH8430495.1 hypothetical protein LDX57_008157 [Aspergillus melleus]